MKMSVIVPAFNEEKLIVETLCRIKRAMTAFSELNWEAELIVCDNNSTDKTSALAKSEGATVVFEPINQISRARNAGAKAATGDWLIFVDADSLPSRELFVDVAEKISTGKYLAGGVTVTFDEAPLEARCLVGLWNSISRTAKYCAGSFIFCDAKAFREVHGFSTELFASEEIDLSKKLKQFGKKSGKKLVILHRFPLVTSARKLKLYSRREHLRVFSRAAFSRSKSLKNRDACELWYDGRR
ncbi:MAG: glycosyltransferase [Limisphaerales bacterium]